MIGHRRNDVGDDIYESANRAGAIENCCRPTNHVDLRNADCLDRGSVSRIESRQIAHAKAVLENEDLVVAQPSQNWARWSGSEAANCDARKIGDFLGEAHPRTVLEFHPRLGRCRLVLLVGSPYNWRRGDNDLFQLDRRFSEIERYPRGATYNTDSVSR